MPTSPHLPDLDERLRQAVRRFWSTRDKQAKKKGKKKDQGSRGAVTGGAQMDGFVDLVEYLLRGAGLPDTSVFVKKKLEVPGFFRPAKKWDLLVVHRNVLIASIEFKSQVGPSFGNNANNRAEEAVGTATDLRAAFREGAFKPSPRPWMGFFILLDECVASTRPVGVEEPHFRVFEEFRDASYAKRYELLCLKLVREGLYDSAAFLLSSRTNATDGGYREPNPELDFRSFASSLIGRVAATLAAEG
jgi:hypothetical protein